MRRQAVTLGLCACLEFAGCGHQQKGYSHNAKQFNEEDRLAVSIVRKSPLGALNVMRQVVDGMVMNEEPLKPCDYRVSKVIRRDQTKTDGEYPVSYTVTCLTQAGDSPELEYVWEVDDSERGVTSFRWGWSERDLDFEPKN